DLEQVAKELQEIIDTIQRDPSAYIKVKSEKQGWELGKELAADVHKKVKEGTATSIGTDVGEIVGRELFEILLFWILEVTTGGAGEGVRGGMAMGERAAQGSTKLGRVAQWLEKTLEDMPALRNLVRKIVGRRAAARAGARAGAAGADEAAAAA